MESGPFGFVVFENLHVPDFRRYFLYFLYLTSCLVISSFHLHVNRRIKTNLNFLSAFLNDFPTLSFLFSTADSTYNIYLYIHCDSSSRDDTQMHNFSLPNAYPVCLNDLRNFPSLTRVYPTTRLINPEKFFFYIVPFFPYFHLHCLSILNPLQRNPTSILLQPSFPLHEVEKTKGPVDSRN